MTVTIDGSNAPMAGDTESVPFSAANTWNWVQSAPFYVTAGPHTITFTNNWPGSSGNNATVFLDDVGIQTVNGLFKDTLATDGSFNVATSTVMMDVAICNSYGINDVGYEGGFDFRQDRQDGSASGPWWNYDDDGMGYTGGTPNIGDPGQPGSPYRGPGDHHTRPVLCRWRHPAHRVPVHRQHEQLGRRHADLLQCQHAQAASRGRGRAVAAAGRPAGQLVQLFPWRHGRRRTERAAKRWPGRSANLHQWQRRIDSRRLGTPGPVRFDQRPHLHCQQQYQHHGQAGFDPGEREHRLA